MKKLKDWLRIKLREFLGVDNLESSFIDHETFNSLRFHDIEKDSNDKDAYLRKLINDNSKDISHFQESVNILHNTVENVVHIGTDVREPKYNNDRSWAIICVEGKLNLVKFVSLDARNARDLIQYLKQFEGGRHCIDTPYSEIFYDGLFKF